MNKNNMVAFTKPTFIGEEFDYIKDSLTKGKLSGGGFYTKKCETFLETTFHYKKAILTPSGTSAIELAALLIDIKGGDEVIMPSYTFTSTANAFILRGAKIVFVDIDPVTMNIATECIAAAINKKTKAIVVVHYAGIACDMDEIKQLSVKNNIPLIEDAAQGIGAFYNNKALGSIGDFGCLSFHDTKNITSGGEGGALLINNTAYIERAEIIVEKGTNRSNFIKGIVDKYTWHDIGSSFLMSEIQAAFLMVQLEKWKYITEERVKAWNKYHKGLAQLANDGHLNLVTITDDKQQNGHIFFIKVKDKQVRDNLISFLKEKEVQAVFHYIPLHSSPAGLKYGAFNGIDKYTTVESERLLRLPIWYGIQDEQIEKVITSIYSFYSA